jgi:PAS domain S-box-containing protein
MKPFPMNVADNLFNRAKNPGLNEVCALVNLDDDPCVLLDHESGNVVFINSKFIRFSGYSTDEILEKPLKLLFPELNLSEIASGDNRTLQVNRRNQTAGKVEARFNYLDAATHWLRVRFTDPAELSAEEKPIDVSSIEKLLGFSTLVDCDTFLEALTRGAGIIQQVSGAQGTAIYQGDTDFPQFNRVAAAGVGSDFPETLPYVDSIRLEDVLIWNPGMRVLTDIHKFGRLNGFTYIASAPLREEKAITGLIVCGGKVEIPETVTEKLLATIASQVRAVQQHYLLMESLQKDNRSYAHMVNLLDAAFSNINEGVILLSPDLTIQHINPAAEWILGYTSQEVQGQDYDNVLIGTDRLSPALEEAAKGVVTHNIGKVTLNRRKGQPFPALVQVVPVMLKEALIGIEIILNDVSENENNKAMAEHLEHRAVLGDYTAAFAHDIRNPINNIALGIQLLGSTLAADDPNQEVIGRIQNDCTRLNHLMESFLAFSRPTELHLETIDIGQFLQRTLDRWHPRLAHANISSHLHIGKNVDKIKGDPRALDRVFTNLISNAVDAMATSGDTLAINAEMNTKVAELPILEITVSDNGPGIPDDLKERIFEPFVSASQKGTGLGLAITKQIVTAHRGSIDVKSFPGGTNFIVCLPTANGDSE